jgi:hypothetical protein
VAAAVAATLLAMVELRHIHQAEIEVQIDLTTAHLAEIANRTLSLNVKSSYLYHTFVNHVISTVMNLHPIMDVIAEIAIEEATVMEAVLTDQTLTLKAAHTAAAAK